MTTIFVGIGIFLCIIMSGFFSSSEMAISSCNTVRLENEAKEGKKSSKRALKLNKKYDDTLSAILVGNNLVNIAASSLGTVFIILLTGSDKLNWVVTLVVTVLIIIFGETVPKIVSKKHANSMAAGVSGIITFLVYLFKPLNICVVGLVNLLTRGLNKYSKDDDEEVTEELQAIIETAEDEGVIDSEQSEIVAAAIDFPDVSAMDVMTARVDMEAIDINDSFEDILKLVQESTHSRLPVYEDSIDNIVGVVHLNHLLKAMASEAAPDIKSIMLEPVYVYKTAKLPKVLNALKAAKQHLAIVSDEYSGTLGVVTMEDVLEQIVGEIWDETDTIEEEVVEVISGDLIIDGDMPISDFLELTKINEDSFDYESQTVGGFAIEYFGDFPNFGDSFEFRGYTLKMLEMDGRRVVKILVSKADTEAEEDTSEKIGEDN